MIELQTQSDQRKDSPARRYRWPIILAVSLGIVSLWYLSQTVLQSVLSGWSTPQLEAIVGQSMHRKVHFGRVWWSLGVYGVVFHTDKLTVAELDDKPFIVAGATDLSVALTPLLSKQVMIRHFDIDKPEVWVRKISATTWNFSDLPKLPPLKDLSHIRVVAGTVHVSDANNLKAHLDVSPLNVELDRRFLSSSWPYAISAQIVHAGFQTQLTLTGTGTGSPDHLLTNNQSVRLVAKQLDLTEFVPFVGKLPDTKGRINLDLDTKIVPDKGMSGKLAYNAPNAVLDGKFNLDGSVAIFKDGLPLKGGQTRSLSVEKGHFALPGTKINVSNLSGKFVIFGDSVKFENASGQLGDTKFDANGQLNNLKTAAVKVHLTKVSIDLVKSIAATLNIPIAPLTGQPIFGTAKNVILSINGPLTEPDIAIDAVPDSLFFTPVRTKNLFVLNGGHVFYKGGVASFSNLAGTMGKGKFVLNGHLDTGKSGKLGIKLASDDLNLDDVKSLFRDFKISLPLLNLNLLGGQVKSASGEINGTASRPEVALNVVPRDLYYQPAGKDKARTFEITKGVIGIDDDGLRFHDAAGKLSAGTFQLNGEVTSNPKAPLNFTVHGQNIDLANVKLAMAALNVQSPLMAEQLIYGTVKTVSLSLRGTAKSPVIDMVAYPDDLHYQPLGSSRIAHLAGGKISFAHDSLFVNEVDVRTARSQLRTTMQFDHLSSDAILKLAIIDSQGLDLGDLHSYLAADKTPRLIRDRYLQALADNNLAPLSGKLKGHFELRADDNQDFDGTGTIHFKNVATKVHGYPVHEMKGKIVAANRDLSLQNVEGLIGKSLFHASGSVDEFANVKARTFDIKFDSDADIGNFLTQIGNSNAFKIKASKPLSISATLTGTSTKVTAEFNGGMSPDAELSFASPIGLIKKRDGQPFNVSGKATVENEKMSLENVLIAFGNSVLRISGDITPGTDAKNPVVDLTVDVPNPIEAQHVLGFLPAEEFGALFKSVTGTIAGRIELKGAIDSPAIKGNVTFNNLGIPAYQFTGMTGSIAAPDWTSALSNNASSRQSSPFNLKIASLHLKKLQVTNIQGNLLAGYWQGRRVISIRDMTGNIAKGKLNLRMGVDQSQPEFGGTIQLTGVDANQLLTELFNAPNEVTGTLSATVEQFSAAVGAGKNFYNTLQIKTGSYEIVNGHVARFSLLQRRITQANLIKSGILGFNLNNLIQSVAPVKEGKFKTIKGTFSLQQNLKLAFNDASFIGDELRMQAGGNIDFLAKNMHVNVAGHIARISERGPLGPIARFLSVRGLAGEVGDELPILPRALRTEDKKPRTFQFTINAPTDSASKITQAIMKSFHWMAPKPNASAHPLVAQDKLRTPAG